nr:ABC transporter permease [Bacteroidota bacterium]
RYFSKNVLFSIINIFGLAVGIAFFVLTTTYIFHELDYDNFHEHAGEIYMPTVSIDMADFHIQNSVATPATMAKTAREQFPEVLASARLTGERSYVFRYKDKKIRETEVMAADSTIFDVFTYSFLDGDERTALNHPNSIVLTKTLASKYFGAEPALGKVIELGTDKEPYKVTGVIEDPPENSIIHFDALISMVSLSSGFINDPIWQNNNFRTYVTGFGLIALFLLIIACINYVNLNTAKATRRAREVGIRKVSGAHRSLLMKQFIIESLLYSFLALIFAMGIVETILPYLSEFLEKDLAINYNVLVFVQFVISIGLIAGSLTVYKQSNMMASKNLGFDKENLLVLIIITIMGLYGLATFMGEEKTKEIGIRKVQGATVTEIIRKFTWNFTKLVTLANIVAWPLAWLFINEWLKNFASQTTISWWIFALAGGFTYLLAFLTVAIQAYIAATRNPVEALRYE